MDFTKEWRPIEFLDYGGNEPLCLADVVPFVFKHEIKNSRASKMNDEQIMILYDLSLEFHEHLCENVDLIYGIKEKDTVTICILVNINDNYLKYCKIVTDSYSEIQEDLRSPVKTVDPTITFLDFNTDILGLISQRLEFKDQLNLRSLCKTMKKINIYHNYENSNFLFKLAVLIHNCLLILAIKIPEKVIVNNKKYCSIHNNTEDCVYECDKITIYTSNNFYSDLKITEGLKPPENIKFLLYSNFKILGINYTFRELLDNIDVIKSLEFLINLLNFDKSLRDQNKSFTLKDKKLMNQHELSDHYRKTNDCYFKFNKDLKLFFDDSEWFNVVKDIICGNKKLEYSLETLESNISPTLEFGKKINENYNEIKTQLSRCKRFYHDSKKFD